MCVMRRLPTHRGYRVPELLSAYRVHRRLWSWSLRPVDSAQYRPPEDSPYLYDERAALRSTGSPSFFGNLRDLDRLLEDSQTAKCLLKSDSRSMNGVSELLCCNAKITSELASEKTPASCQVLLQSPSRATLRRTRGRLRTGTSPRDCVKTVSKPLRFGAMELCLSEKQMPQVIGLIRSCQNQGERLERACVRPRQVRYQAALRPDCIRL